MRYNCPTNAGILLFGKQPTNFLFGAYIQYVEFKGQTLGADVGNEHKFAGDLFTVLTKLDTFIETAVIRKHPVPVSALREGWVKNYPYLALRELMMNAVMHRDYESNIPIRFYEYSNRMELMNAGALFGNDRPENFPNVNDYRNPVIAVAMKVVGYVNRFSRGLTRVREKLLENGNGLAVFDFSKLTVFEVKVPMATPYLHFTNPVISLLKLLAGHQYASSQMRSLFGVSHRDTFRKNYIRQALIAQTILERPNSRLQKYKLKASGKHYLTAHLT
jgi:ATP-dependent DNA helicase RecG